MMGDESDSDHENYPMSSLDRPATSVERENDDGLDAFDCEDILESQEFTAIKRNEHLLDYGKGDNIQIKEGAQSIRGKIKRAGEIGHQERWDQMFSRLLDFREKVGNCLVPNRYAEDPKLGTWVATQRRQYKIFISQSNQSTPMTPERARRLEQIGFEWNPKDLRAVPWDARFTELVEFVAKNGHAQVPMKMAENPAFSNWVSTQRQEYKLLKKGLSSRLTPDRIKKLESVGFIWEAKRGCPGIAGIQGKATRHPSGSTAHSHQRISDFDVADTSASSFGGHEVLNQWSSLSATATQPWAMGDSLSIQSQNIALAAAKQQEIELMQRALLSQERQTNFIAQNDISYNPNNTPIDVDAAIRTLQAQEEQARRKRTIEELLQLQQYQARKLEDMHASLSTAQTLSSQLPEQQSEQSNQSISPLDIASELQNYQRLPSSSFAHRFHDIDPQMKTPLITNQQQDTTDTKDIQSLKHIEKIRNNSNFAMTPTYFSDDRKPSPVSTPPNLDRAESDKRKKRRQN